MKSRATYQAAQTVSKPIEDYFSKLHNGFSIKEKHSSYKPDSTIIAAILDAAFWASLRREEGHSPKISLAYLSPRHSEQPLIFRERLPLSSVALTILSPAVERPGIHLGVWCENDELYIWGTTRTVPDFCFILDVSDPGLLVIKHRRNDGFGKYANVAVLNGDDVKLVDEASAKVPDCPSLVSRLLGFTKADFWKDSFNILVQLAVSMRAHGRGGCLLIVPVESEEWRASILHPIKYAVEPSFSGLYTLMKEDKSQQSNSNWQMELKREVDHIAGLTAVDGATILSDQYHLLAFGAKIGRRGKTVVEKIYSTEPIIGSVGRTILPSQNGGTRHLSAAQFVFDQNESIALVASQDGRFTVFSWSSAEQIVLAHRIDALLL